MSTNSYKKHFVVLLSGTLSAQIIGILISPILTRLYSSSEYGYYGLYLSIVSILGILATLRYEFAINIEEKIEYVISINKLIKLVSVITFLFILVIGVTYSLVTNSFKSNFIFIIFVGLATLLTGVLQSTKYILNREKLFKSLSLLAIVQITISSLLSMIFSFTILRKYGLLIGNIMGLVLIVYLQNSNRFVNSMLKSYKPSLQDIKYVAKKYSKFPKYNLISTLFDQVSLQLPVFFLTYFFSTSTLGLFSLTTRTLLLPLNLIGNTISQIFLSQISDKYRNKLSFQSITLKLLFLLVITGIPIFTILFFVADNLFSLVFGDTWKKSGEFASLLAFGLFFRFITNPLSSVLLITQEVKSLSLLQFTRLFSTNVTLYFACSNLNINHVLIIYSMHESIYYLMYLLIILIVVRKYHKRFG